MATSWSSSTRVAMLRRVDTSLKPRWSARTGACDVIEKDPFRGAVGQFACLTQGSKDVDADEFFDDPRP